MGSIDVGLLSVNNHKTNFDASEDILLNDGVVPFFVDHSYAILLGR